MCTAIKRICATVLVLMMPFLLVGSHSKDVTVTRERGRRPILFWHPMKSGGTSFCQMAKENEYTPYHIEKYGFNEGINCKLSKSERNSYASSEMAPHIATEEERNSTYFRFLGPITKDGIRIMQTTYERGMIAYEPAHPGGTAWKQANPFKLLENHVVWTEYYHVFMMRHPIDRIFSHLFFSAIWRHCMPTERFEEMIMSTMNGTCDAYCKPEVCDYVHGQIDSFYLRHLSGTPTNLTKAAYHLLYDIDQVVNLIDYPELTSAVTTAALGWKEVDPDTHSRPGKSLQLSYRETYPMLYERLTEYVRDDMQLYDLGMEKARRWCTQNPCHFDASEEQEDPQVITRRQDTWEFWMKAFADMK